MVSHSSNTGGPSGSPNVLPFPQTKRALRHYRTNMSAAGFLSLILLEQDGEEIPANVERFDEPEETLPTRSPELLLALLIWQALTAKQRDQVKHLIRCMAYGDKTDTSAIQLHNMLNRRL